MYRYIMTRVLSVFPTLIGAAVLVFILMRLIPGDICVVRLGSGGGSFSEHSVQMCHAELGLNRPILLQFASFVWGIFTLNLGNSMWSGKPVVLEIATRLPISIEIALLAAVIAILVAIPLGTISALKQNTWLDLAVRTVAIAGIATPSFWLGILSIIAVLDITQAISGTPWMPPIDYVPLWQDPIRNLSMTLLPALTVGYRYAAVSMRMTRSTMLEVMREDYIRTARSKGLLRRIIINRHALKNALLPVVTLGGLAYANLLSGAVLTETIFSWPGLGRYTFQSAVALDFPAIMGMTVIVASVFVLVNLLVDISYALLDPRVLK